MGVILTSNDAGGAKSKMEHPLVRLHALHSSELTTQNARGARVPPGWSGRSGARFWQDGTNLGFFTAPLSPRDRFAITVVLYQGDFDVACYEIGESCCLRS